MDNLRWAAFSCFYPWVIFDGDRLYRSMFTIELSKPAYARLEQALYPFEPTTDLELEWWDHLYSACQRGGFFKAEEFREYRLSEYRVLLAAGIPPDSLLPEYDDCLPGFVPYDHFPI